VENLVDGVRAFQANIFRPRRELFERLAKGQRPAALFLTCSGSRIDPNLLTRSEPGDLFVVRNAGNLVPPHGSAAGGEAASVEFAVAALRVQDVIVCGHTDCGAMTALLRPEAVRAMPAVAAWLSHAEPTRRVVRDNYGHLDGEALVTKAVETNVLAQLDNLRTLPAVASRLERGDLELHGWVYDIETGEVHAYDPEGRQFVPVARRYASHVGPAVRRHAATT
jgi:carbonic anhydrase